MASRELKVEIIGDSRSLEKALGRAADSSSKFGSAMSKTAKVVGLAFVAAGAAVTAGFIYTLKRGFDELAESQKVMAQTEAVLKSTGQTANVTAKDVTSLSESLSKMSGVDDEVIQSGENMLLTFTNIRNEMGKGNDVFNQATATLLDMSTALGTDMNKSAIQLGKALNDPIKGITALQRVGVSFTEGQRESIKAMVEAGNTMGAQKLILAELNKEFGGSAKAFGDTMPGQLAKLRNAFDEVAGNLAVKFLPILTGLVEWVNANWPTIEAVINAVGTGVMATFNAIGVTVDYLRNQWEIHRETVIATWNTVQQSVMKVITWFQTNVVPVIQNVISAATAIWNNFGGEIRAIGGRLVESVKITIQNMMAPMKILILLLKGDFSGAWEEAKAVVTRTLGGMAENIKAILSATASVVGALAAKIGMAILDGIWGKIKDLGAKFRDAFEGVYAALRTAAGEIAGVAGRIVLAMIEPFTHLPSFLGAPFRDAKNAINQQLGIIKTESGNVAQQTGYSVGFFMGMGLNAGIAASTAAAVETARQAALKVAEALRTAAQTKSPSRVTMEIGKDMGLGLAMGLAQALADASPAAKDKARKFIGEATNILDTVRAKGYDLGNKQVQAVIDGIIGKTPSLKQQIMTAIDEANRAAEQRIRDAKVALKEAWASVWSEVAQAGLDAIEKKWAGWENPFQKQLDKLDLEETKRQIAKGLEDAYAAFDTATAAAAKYASQLEAVSVAGQMLSGGSTVAEAIAGLPAEMQKLFEGLTPEEAQKKLQELRDGIIEAQKKAADDIAAAREQIRLAELAKERFRLQELAKARQDAHDKQVQKEKDDFEADLQRLIRQVKRQKMTWKEAQDGIIKLFKEYGVDYRAAGKALGESFAKGIKDGLAAVGSAVEELADAIAARLKRSSPAPREGPLKDIHKWGARLMESFMSGFNANLINKELNKIKVPDTFQRPPMLEGLSQWTEQSFGGVAEPGGSPFASMGIPPGVNSSLYQFAATLALAAGKFDEFVEDMWKGRTNARILDLLFQNRTRWNWAQFPPWIASILNTMRDLGLSGAEAAPMYGLARGGIITSPTRALIGEAGPEAVVPLSRYRGGMGGKVVVNIGTVVGTPTRAIADAWATEIDSALARKRGRTGALALD